MTHREAWARLDEFLDGALPAETRWAVAAHLDDCAVCRQHVAREARLRGIVRERLVAVVPPDGLDARLAAALAAAAVTPQAVVPRPWPPRPVRLLAVLGPALAAVLLLAVLATSATQANAALRKELTTSHALFARDESLLDVAGDAAVVSRWFRAEAGLQIFPPEIGPYTLVGGRLIALQGEPVAQLVYERESAEGYLSLLQFAHNGADPGWTGLGGVLGVAGDGPISLVTWVAGQDRVALIGAVPEGELRRLAAEFVGRSIDAGSPTG